MRRAAPHIFFAVLLLAGAFAAVPASADTESELEQARQQLDSADAELQRIAASLNEAESAYAQVRDAVEATEARVAELAERLAEIQVLLEGRVVEAFMSGGSGGELGALLSSDSFAEFSDRLEYVGKLVETDADLAAEAEVNREQLTREQAQLEVLAQRRQEEAEQLRAQQASANAETSKLTSLVENLKAKYAEEQAALEELQLAQSSGGGGGGDSGGGGPAPQGNGAIQVCPVAGPNSFVDSFGAPRSGGRSHQGQDLLAPLGTPVVAVHDGNAVQNYNSLGGNSVLLYHDGGDYTYYAHLDSYGASGHVSTGTVIGQVGSTGNAGSINHLHFEYHPGGGAAANPYSMLTAVC